ncbi:hypothetical protein [Tunturiibacter gelidiferens]|uniref:hypothetical protein n=1 Tax=Tunturiibacter gelidiferens TaxID=3069689 RepID=UPI003D9B1700
MLTSTRTVLSAASLLLTTATLTAQQASMQNPFLGLMTAAGQHARAHNAQTPVLSPSMQPFWAQIPL